MVKDNIGKRSAPREVKEVQPIAEPQPVHVVSKPPREPIEQPKAKTYRNASTVFGGPEGRVAEKENTRSPLPREVIPQKKTGITESQDAERPAGVFQQNRDNYNILSFNPLSHAKAIAQPTSVSILA